MMKYAVMAVSLAAMVAQAGTLTEARGQIDACVADPAKMTAVIKDLPAGDQASFLGEVNEAIASMPGSAEAKAAKFINVNKAALKGAAKGNLPTLVAEVYATVSPESLPAVTERLAEDQFNRAANATRKFTDEEFRKLVEPIVSNAVARTESQENGAARAAFAIVMCAQASGGSPADLSATLAAMLPESAREQATGEWLPAALGQGQPQSYDPLLAALGVTGALPSNAIVLRLTGTQLHEIILNNLVNGLPLLEAWAIPADYTIGYESWDTEAVPPPGRYPGGRHPSKEPQGYQNQY